MHIQWTLHELEIAKIELEKNTFERITLITKFEVCHKDTVINFGISMKIDI